METNILTKCCTKCGEEKLLAEFSKSKKDKSGIRSQCKGCVKIYSQQNKEYIAEWNKEYTLRNKGRLKEYNKEYYKINKPEKAKYSAEYQKIHKEKLKEYFKNYYKQNKSTLLEKIKIYSKKYQKLNRPKLNASWAQYNALKKRQLHQTHNKNIEITLRNTAARVSLCIGIKHHIDHIFPLHFGGVHHHQNLHIIPEVINISKGCKLAWEHPPYKSIKDLPTWLLKACENNYDKLNL